MAALPATTPSPAADLSAASSPATVLPEVHAWVWPWLADYQREGIAFAIVRGNAHLHWQTGAGKTAAAILWALAVDGPVIAVTRPSARRQWCDEIRRFTAVEPYDIRPASDRRAGDEPLVAYCARVRRPFVVVGWPGLRDDADAITHLLRTWRGQTVAVIYDEVHCAKDHKRWSREDYTVEADARAALAAWTQPDTGLPTPNISRPSQPGEPWVVYFPVDTLAARAAHLGRRVHRRLGLTATPVPDRQRDLWAQMDLIEPGVCGPYWPWARRFCNATEGQYGWDDRGASNTSELTAFLRQRVHTVPSEVVNRELRHEVRRILTRIPKEMLTRSDKAADVAVRAAARAAGGGTGAEGGSAATALVQARLEQSAAQKTRYTVDRIVECAGQGQKVIAFTGRRVDVDRLAAKVVVKIKGARKGTTLAGAKLWHAHGETPPDERAQIREQYMAHQGASILIGTGAAWGESLNLHDTDRLIIVMLPWTWGQIRQWEGRVVRLGMGRAVTIEYLIAGGTYDERVATVVLGKLAAVEDIVPDAQIAAVRETVQGGTDDEILDALLADL